ncbi:hypothetical protein PIB30_012560 [Stylosanthes scabra]|uniref:Uncharacterized protein n=1 Tax=Stylosanthes scabra TaxID=79078 RepID=A0ABU6W993_9FABA|nr:hypothetical protein [Stylosanthes scabra]
MGRDRYGIWFQSPTPVVFQMYPVVTLEELKSVILRNMGLGAIGTSLVRRVAYRLLNVFPPNPFKFKIFRVDSNEHVRALFDLHRSMPEVVGGSSNSNGVISCSPIHCPGPKVPMPIDGNSGDSDEEFVPDIEESNESSDGSEFVPESQSRRGFLLPAPAPISDLLSVNSHFHTLHLEDMDEEPMEGFGEGGDYYDVDGGEEFRVGHRFNEREAIHLGVKNYNIRRAPSTKWLSLINRSMFVGANGEKVGAYGTFVCPCGQI